MQFLGVYRDLLEVLCTAEMSFFSQKRKESATRDKQILNQIQTLLHFNSTIKNRTIQVDTQRSQN